MSDPTPPPIMAGFATLAALKAATVPALPPDNTQFDATLTRLGIAVAMIFEMQTRRKLARRESDLYVFQGDRAFTCVPRYPIETISLYEFLSYGDVQADGSTPNWITYNDQFVTTVDPEAGLIQFGEPWGASLDRVRVTYTGGYWVDDGNEMPEGATPLPEDLQQAFFLQCAQQYEAQDILGLGIVRDEKTDAAAQKAGVPLLPIVSQILGLYARVA